MSTGPAIEPLLGRDDEESLFARDFNGQLVRMEQVTDQDLQKRITIKIDGLEVTVNKAAPETDSQGNNRYDQYGKLKVRPTTIYDAATQLYTARNEKNPIPILCHQEHLDPVAVCRLCVVQIATQRDGKTRVERKLLPACQHRVQETMEVQTIESKVDPAAAERIRGTVKVLTELLMADALPGKPGDQPAYNELACVAQRLDLAQSRFAARTIDRGRDDSSQVIAVDHNQCILCDRCVRGCDDVKKNQIIGRTGKGYSTHIGFDLNEPMGESHCVSCGECMISCPTGALTFRNKVSEPSIADSDVRERGRKAGAALADVTVEELKSNPDGKQNYDLFRDIPWKFLEWNSGSVRRRMVSAGEVLCREGEPGSTAFVLVSGKYDVSIRTKPREVANVRGGGLLSFLGKVKTVLVDRGGDKSTQGIRSDATMLDHGARVATRTPDDVILGEMTCMSHYPRSATVVAAEAGEVLEINRNVLYYLQRNKRAREIFDRAYRGGALANHLRNSPLFSALRDLPYTSAQGESLAGLGGKPMDQAQACAQFLQDKVELVRVEPGQVVFRQGDRADHFYMVRLGFVKVSENYLGQDRVLNYLGPGNSFGEIALLSGMSGMADQFPTGVPQGLRTATCTALDDVELVRIRGENFREMLDRFPAIVPVLVQYAKQLLERQQNTRQVLDKPLDEFLDQGLFNAQRLLVLDLESCTRCDECTKACSDTHHGVTRLIREGMRYGNFLVASSCRSCMDPYCLVGCPVDAIHREARIPGEPALEIRIKDHCIGCGQCAKNCPYGNINMHGFYEGTAPDPRQPERQVAVYQQRATTCDLCSEVFKFDKQRGKDKDVSCVYACPHNAAFRMSGQELLAKVNGPGN